MKYAHQLIFCSSGIGQRPEDIKQSAHPQLAPYGSGMFHGTVEIGREHETETDFTYVLRYLRRCLVEVDTQRFEHIGFIYVVSSGRSVDTGQVSKLEGI